MRLCDQDDKPAMDNDPILAQLTFTAKGFKCDADMEYIKFLEKKINEAELGMEKNSTLSPHSVD